MTGAGIAVTEISDGADLASLREEWNELLESSAADTLFLRHEWLALWWEHFGAGRRPAVLLARRGDRLAAALPLMESRETLYGVPATVLRSMTNRHSYRFNGIVRRGDEEAAAALWDHLATRSRAWHALILEEVPDDVPVLAPMFARARAAGAHAGAWGGGDVPYLTVTGSWDEYQATLTAKFKANLRRRRRGLSEHGSVAYRCVAEPAGVAAALVAGLKLEGSGWKETSGSAIASDRTLTEFYARWADIAAAQGWLRLSFLEVGERSIAFDYSAIYRGRYYNMKIGYDPAWDRFSAGQILKEEILRRCFEDGVSEYDFLGIVNPSKLDWKPKTRGHVWHFLYPPSPLGRYFHAMKFRVTPAARRLLKR